MSDDKADIEWVEDSSLAIRGYCCAGPNGCGSHVSDEMRGHHEQFHRDLAAGRIG